MHAQSTCGQMTVLQGAGKGSPNSKLEITLENAKHPIVMVSRVTTSDAIDLTKGQGDSWTGNSTIKTGSWLVQYLSGREICGKKILSEVTCSPGYNERAQQCEPQPLKASKTNPTKLIAGGLVGAVAVLGLAFLIYYASKNPARFRKLIVSFLLNEIVVFFSISAELWDICGDSYTFYTVIILNRDDVKLPFAMVVLYILAFAVACLVWSCAKYKHIMACLYMCTGLPRLLLSENSSHHWA